MFAALQPGASHVTAPAGAAAAEDCAPTAADRATAQAIIAAFERVLAKQADRGYQSAIVNTALVDIAALGRRGAAGIPDGLAAPIVRIVLGWLEERRESLEAGAREALRLARAL